MSSLPTGETTPHEVLISSAPDYMFLADTEGRLEFINRVDPSTSREDVLGRPVWSFAPEPALAEEVIRRVANTGVEESHTLQSGDSWYLARVRRVVLGQAHKVAVFVTDITEQHRTQAALKATVEQLEESRRQTAHAQKLESVGRLAGGVAHDFNNLLTAIISFTRFVVDDMAAEDPRRSDLCEVLKAADSASKLTRQLLAFSRNRATEAVLTDLNDAIARFARVLTRTLGESIHLRLLASPEPVPVVVDPGQLDQMVMNLAVNARDAMPKGGTLTIEVGSRQISGHGALADGHYASFTVADTGTGMGPETLRRLFEPFFSTKGELGNGLGLATCYGIAKTAQGHIEVESHPGLGSRFTVLLPLASGVAPARSKQAQSNKPVVAAKATSVALVVEDQAAIRRTIVRSLQRAGFNVIDVRSAEDALSVVEELDTKLDLLVTDVVLPGLNGVKLAERLRDRQPDLRVLMCSGYTGDDQQAGEIPLGPNTAFLPKPFTGSDLVEAATCLLA
jgi:two-component system, cell cycle sensor histidine kinase and response regulator CckA